MNKLKSLFLLLLLPTFAVTNACDNQFNGSGIKGTVEGASNLQVTLERANFDRSSVSLGRSTCNGDGAFEIQLEKPWEEGLYRLKIGAKQIYFIIDGKEKVIEITGELSTIDKMDIQIAGSETMKCYAGIIKDLVNKQLKTPEEAKTFIQRGCTPLMQTFFTIQLLGQNAGQFMDDFKAQSQALNAAMPGSKYASDFISLISKLETQKNQPQEGEAITVGMPAPDISLPDPSGKVHSLSSMKGKVVLLDFWASWCGPCRKANPHVVEIYNKYKGKGFDVFSVSLDKEDGKQKWIDAIKQDGLVWGNHVSDLKFWDSAPAAVYGVRSIPKTFLIGKDGKIVAVNPRENLEAELLKVL
ncbi:MAG: TlpA family protein disulfide reductase [Phycisphaerae bacterium]|nr:TlpA family protein disulfide reductase [Saprospiraceae bacterium]